MPEIENLPLRQLAPRVDEDDLVGVPAPSQGVGEGRTDRTAPTMTTLRLLPVSVPIAPPSAAY